MYLICDGGYLRWETLVCPYAGDHDSGWCGYYNTNLVGELKKRWRILDYGLNLYSMKDCEKVFTVCCVLHNMLLGLGERYGISVVAGRGRPLPGDRLWLEGPEEMTQRFMGETCPAAIKAADRREAALWSSRRDMLAEHCEYSRAFSGNNS